MKEAIAKRVQAKQPHRQHFLKKNLEILKPFLEPKVLQNIRGYSTLNIVDTEPLHLVQPDGIKADMRDYQLKGLNFISEMYGKGLGCILGDGELTFCYFLLSNARS